MRVNLNIKDLSNPNDVKALISAISMIADAVDILYTETAPNGVTSARIGRIALYYNGADYETWQNIDGDTTWQRIDVGAAPSDFLSGDYLLASNNTARDGWTDVSAANSNKFMRINATPGSTGGADTVTLAETNLPAHAHAYGTLAVAAHNHSITGTDGHPLYNGGDSPGYRVTETAKTNSNDSTYKPTSSETPAISGSTANTGSGTSFSVVPAFITMCLFKKD